jgi:hypothetical protein
MESTLTVRTTLAGLLIPLLFACAAEPRHQVRVDGATPDSFNRSWSKLVASLSRSEQAELNGSVLVLVVVKASKTGLKQGAQIGLDPAFLREELDGKNFDEIIASSHATGARLEVKKRAVD